MQRTIVRTKTFRKGGYFQALRLWDSPTGGLHLEMHGTTWEGEYHWSYTFGGSKTKRGDRALSFSQAKQLLKEIDIVLQGGYARPVDLGGRQFWPSQGSKKSDKPYVLYLEDGRGVLHAPLDASQMEAIRQALCDFSGQK